jgi:hypothetical protein
MVGCQTQLPSGRAVGRQLVRLHEDVQDLAPTVDGLPQGHTPTLDRDHHLAQVPGCGRSGSQSALVGGKRRPEFENPPADRLIGDVESALGQEFLNISMAQCEPEVEPDSVPDDPRRELVSSIGDGLDPPTLPCISPGRQLFS